MVYPILIALLIGVNSIVYMVFPIEREGYIEKYDIDMTIDTPLHQVKVDDLYFYEDGQCSITLRTYQKFWKSRVYDTFSLKLVDQTENEVMTARGIHTAGMASRYDIKFLKDGMSSIYIQTADGQVLEISLEEEAYETK